MDKTCQNLLKENSTFTRGEKFEMDGNMYLSELVGRKLVLMVDPEITEDHVVYVGYEVFKESAEKGAIMSKKHRASSSKKIVPSEKDGSSAIIQGSNSLAIGSTQSVVCNKRLNTLYDEVPRIVKQKLQDAFTICVKPTNALKVDDT